MPHEVVLGLGPKNKFLCSFLIEVLTETQIRARCVPACDLPEEIRTECSVPSHYEAFCVLVPAADGQRARQILEYTIYNCKICLHCEDSYVKPGEGLCPKCGQPVDPRDPDEIRRQYAADLSARE